MRYPGRLIFSAVAAVGVIVVLFLIFRWQGLSGQRHELLAEKRFLEAVEKVEKVFVLNNGFYPVKEDLAGQLVERFPAYQWPEGLVYQALPEDCDNKDLRARCLKMMIYGEERCYRSDEVIIREVDGVGECLGQ